MTENNYLFQKYYFPEVCNDLRENLLREIEGLQANYLLNVNIDDLTDYLISIYSFDPPILNKDKTEIYNHGEKKVQVKDFGEYIKRNANFFTFAIPFSGDSKFFIYNPNIISASPPRGIIKKNELLISYTILENNTIDLKKVLEKDLSEIEDYLKQLKSNAIQWNNNLKSIILERIKTRKSKLLKHQGMVASLDFPIRKRVGLESTYSAPIKRKKIVIQKPKATQQPYRPEPALQAETYEQILKTLSNMALVMERSPHAFSEMEEEDLRMHFLVQLNGNYEGNATGETFNYSGKSDILIRVDGKNIFIAECKFWRGSKGLTETIDQLLGYLSWRDTKTAILLFNRNKNLSKVLSQIPETIKKHPNFKKYIEHKNETEFRFTLRSKVDENRELIVTLLVFDIPVEVS